MTPARGMLIALEGVDGSGKSTQANRLAGALGEGTVLTFEPGATALGSLLRGLLLDGDDAVPTERAEALLMAADRAEHVARVVRPALEAGHAVVTDRFSGSTLAYQGYGRGLPLGDLEAVVAWAAGGLEPDLNVLVDVPVDVARRRLAATAPDRLERMDEGFFARVREGYRALADADPARWAIVDGDAPPGQVAARVARAVADRLGLPADASAAQARPT